MIGFGVAKREADHSKIEIINVDDFSGRRAGLEQRVVVSGREFTVGIGHAVVDLLLTELPRPIHADANASSSRYICKSLGFVPVDEHDDCLLVLR